MELNAFDKVNTALVTEYDVYVENDGERVFVEHFAVDYLKKGFPMIKKLLLYKAINPEVIFVDANSITKHLDVTLKLKKEQVQQVPLNAVWDSQNDARFKVFFRYPTEHTEIVEETSDPFTALVLADHHLYDEDKAQLMIHDSLFGNDYSFSRFEKIYSDYGMFFGKEGKHD